MPPGANAASVFAPSASPSGNHERHACAGASQRWTATTRGVSPATASATGVSAPRQALLTEVRTHAGGPFGKAVHASIREALGGAVEEMREDGELQPWVDPDLLTKRIAGVERNVNTEYGVGDLAGEQLVDMTVYAVCILLTGVTRGATAERCVRLARERQAILTAGAAEGAAAASAG